MHLISDLQHPEVKHMREKKTLHFLFIFRTNFELCIISFLGMKDHVTISTYSAQR